MKLRTDTVKWHDLFLPLPKRSARYVIAVCSNPKGCTNTDIKQLQMAGQELQHNSAQVAVSL